MLQLKNKTPFAAAIALFPNERGVDTLYTVVKASFKIGRQWTLLEEQQPPQQEDLFLGDPTASSLRLTSDFHTGKAATDIYMLGLACAPEQRAVRQLDVSLTLGAIKKTVRVFGDRCWDAGRISAPTPYVTMPLIYEKAFGGRDFDNEHLRSAEARNPVGLGFAGKKKASEMDASPLPNLECPRQLIQDFRDLPTPACFSPVAAHWQPRIAYAGTYDAAWQAHRAPYLPEDYSPRFMNSAHPELIYSGFMQGNEPVKIQGMHPEGELNFNIPQVNLLNKVLVSGVEHPGQFVMESVILDPNQLQLFLVWRSVFECDKKAQKIDQILVNMVR